MTSKKARVTINDELQSLIDNSKTTPAVLVAKLITDMLSSKYDKQADTLMKRRAALIKKIVEKVKNDVGPGRLGHYWDHGAEITIQFGVPVALSKSSISQVSPLNDYFRSLDNCAPLSASSGMARIMNISMFKKGPALGWAASMLFNDAYSDSGIGQKTRSFREQYGITKQGFLYGVEGYRLVLKNKEPVLRVIKGETTYEEGGTVSTFLKNVDFTLFEKLQELSNEEAKMATAMYADMSLLAIQTAKIRGLARLLRKMPDMLEHPDLKMLLGFNVNPQAERVAYITRTLSGDAFLNPADGV